MGGQGDANGGARAEEIAEGAGGKEQLIAAGDGAVLRAVQAGGFRQTDVTFAKSFTGVGMALMSGM